MIIGEPIVGRIYRGPRREEAAYGGAFLYREVTWTDEEYVYFRRPFQYGECFHSKIATFQRWAKLVLPEVPITESYIRSFPNTQSEAK